MLRRRKGRMGMRTAQVAITVKRWADKQNYFPLVPLVISL